MMRNLKAQCTLLLPSIAMVLGVLLVFIPYSVLTSSGSDPTYVYHMELFLMIPLLQFVYMISTGGILLPMALSYGATRRGWFLALIASKAGTSLLFSLFAVFVCLPLSAVVFGNPVELNPSLVPVLFLVSFALATAGEFLGYLGANKGAKFMIVVMIAAVVLFLVGFMIAFVLAWNEVGLLGFTLSKPLVMAVCAGIAAVFQPLNWLFVRRLAAR